ncbi:hypothetical protein ROBYS_32240 [Roseobacter sp. OBYS 0001]|nr:hypothetical protein ROBYS_32240 [Roseobacter sp. OBYS 0001]
MLSGWDRACDSFLFGGLEMKRFIGHEGRDCGMQKNGADGTSVSLKIERGCKHMKMNDISGFDSTLS